MKPEIQINAESIRTFFFSPDISDPKECIRLADDYIQLLEAMVENCRIIKKEMQKKYEEQLQKELLVLRPSPSITSAA